ncbi:adenylosuccinate synthetase [Neolewinella persica]|uniref:adenylosuccinate synthetase n=1 Tax=Neolewinella persica TaxID=70998 RepID=UPI000369EC61|nr:adenylosuccinate synthetase [Neolewinella persica]
MTTKIILGLAFGDEGKGVTTDYLCRQAERPLVVRFSGGHQAGHTVVTPEGQRHVFSNFGAGTLAGAPTFWSRYCTFHPVGYANEREALLELGVRPTLFVDGLAAVTTPYDLLYNRHLEASQKHGSCGLGFGATVARQEGPHKLHVMDLLDDFVLSQKLASVASYYVEKLGVAYDEAALDLQLESFHEAVAYCRSNLLCTSGRAFFSSVAESYDTIVFEGSQGLLLDQDFGYFPHVTRAHVSSRNALALVREYALPKPDIFYVTRAYQTRHGNGPLTNEDLPGPELHPTPYETNIFNPWQGAQRRSLLDLNQLRYALRADAQYSAGLPRHLVVTCLDQLAGAWQATDEDRPVILDSPKALAHRLGGLWAGSWGNYGQAGNLVDVLP